MCKRASVVLRFISLPRYGASKPFTRALDEFQYIRYIQLQQDTHDVDKLIPSFVASTSYISRKKKKFDINLAGVVLLHQKETESELRDAQELGED